MIRFVDSIKIDNATKKDQISGWAFRDIYVKDRTEEYKYTAHYKESFCFEVYNPFSLETKPLTFSLNCDDGSFDQTGQGLVGSLPGKLINNQIIVTYLDKAITIPDEWIEIDYYETFLKEFLANDRLFTANA